MNQQHPIILDPSGEALRIASSHNAKRIAEERSRAERVTSSVRHNPYDTERIVDEARGRYQGHVQRQRVLHAEIRSNYPQLGADPITDEWARLYPQLAALRDSENRLDQEIAATDPVFSKPAAAESAEPPPLPIPAPGQAFNGFQWKQ